MDLILTSEERELLLELLEERHREMLREISRSQHHHHFRASLKRNEELIDSMIGKLRAVQPGELAGQVL